MAFSEAKLSREAAPLAVASFNEAAANACTIQGPNASKLAGY